MHRQVRTSRNGRATTGREISKSPFRCGMKNVNAHTIVGFYIQKITRSSGMKPPRAAERILSNSARWHRCQCNYHISAHRSQSIEEIHNNLFTVDVVLIYFPT